MSQRRLDHERRSAALAELSMDQDRVVSRKQLLALGYDRHAVARQVNAGRWQLVGPRVVVLHTGPLVLRQQQWVAVLHSGPGSALCGLSAVQAEGLAGFEALVQLTVVPHGADATHLDHEQVHVRVRQSGRGAAEVHPARRPARERLPSAIITAASAAPSDQRARLLVISAVQQRRVRPDQLRAVMSRRCRIARRQLITEAVDDAEGGVHSLPEAEWLSLVRRHRLPSAVRQQAVSRSTGTWYLDCDFECYGVAVEINGAQHEALLLAECDNDRRNVLAIGGRLVVTFSSYAVRHEGEMCIAVTAAALLSRGWRPSAQVRAHLQGVADAVGVDLATGERRRARH